VKIPIKWLAEYVDIRGLSPKTISEGLRFSGTENVLEEAGFEGVVVGRIERISKHPRADRLRIAEVTIGQGGKKLRIVCGAPNIKTGQKVPVALLGAEIGGVKTEKTVIRGVESEGMLCSEKELGLGEDEAGIMILEEKARLGRPLAEHLGTGGAVICAEITPNRGDCLSIIGIAREVAAVFDRKMKLPKFKKTETASSEKIKVSVKEEKLCPRYVAKVVEGLKIGPSPDWLRERLLAAGVRPISNVVDVTNYVMLEWGQPLHAFDLKKIRSEKGASEIIVRLAKRGETVETLDGVERKLSADDLVIADRKKPIAVAGVMGGAESEISSKTTSIVLEAAVFDGDSVRKTAQRHGNRTEASNRFEKGVPLRLPEIAIERAAELLSEVGGGRKVKAGESTDVLSSWIWIQHVGLRLSRIEEVLGIGIPKEKVTKILSDLGFRPEEFDFKKEARKHVGKPYVFGAKRRTHGDMAFDCSYLTDYIYSLLGKFIGHTALAQFELGRPVSKKELRPGDILFVKENVKRSATDHYFVPDGEGGHRKVKLKEPKEVGHNALYIGGGRIIHAKAAVFEEEADTFLKRDDYLGARRYLDEIDGLVAATAPWWRPDIKIEEDLIEEIARIWGYDKIPATLPSGDLPLPEKNESLSLSRNLRERLISTGYSEVMTYSFVSKEAAGFQKKAPRALKITNPISEDQKYMRTSLLPSLLSVAAQNQENFEEVKIFELAGAYLGDKEEPRLGVLCGGAKKRAADLFFDLKGALTAVLGPIEGIGFKPEADSLFRTSSGAAIVLSGRKIGHLGIVDKKTRESFGLKGAAAVAEISTERLLGKYGLGKFRPLPKYPLPRRDLDLLFDKSRTAKEIEDCLLGIDEPHLLGFEIIDIYEGKGLPEGKKSVTISLTIGSDSRTLTETEIGEVEKKVLGALGGIDGVIRT